MTRERQMGDVFRATFKPRRVDDIRPAALPFIGVTSGYKVLWRITEADGGEYVGEYACEPDWAAEAKIIWVPSGDLEEV